MWLEADYFVLIFSICGNLFSIADIVEWFDTKIWQKQITGYYHAYLLEMCICILVI